MKRRIFFFNTIVTAASLLVLLAVSGLITRQMTTAPDSAAAQVRAQMDGWEPEAAAMAVIAAAAVVIIAALSLVSAHCLVKLILRPIQALTDAARRVEAGDYTRPVGYGGQDEFTAVCAAFDRMQRRLLEEREKNAVYERARADLVSGLSHDLRTPLTSVQGCLKGLRDGVASTPEKRAQYLEIAYHKACDMEVLLQRLFHFSRLETGALPLSPVCTGGVCEAVCPGHGSGAGTAWRAVCAPGRPGSPPGADGRRADAPGAHQPDGQRPALCRGAAPGAHPDGVAGSGHGEAPLRRQRPGGAGGGAAPPV